jgi:galactose-1-phosphate uridylyltransferase
MRTSKLNLFVSIRACRAVAGPRRVISAQTWLAGVLILLLFPEAFAESDFSAFWKKFKFTVIAGNKTAVAEMTKFPVSMGYGVKAVKNKESFLRRYDEIFDGEANAAQCFAKAEPRKESAQRYEIYCPFKETPNDRENAPIRFIFELTKSGWKFAGLDNINE